MPEPTANEPRDDRVTSASPDPEPPTPRAPRTEPAERSVLDEPAAEDRDESWGERGPGRDDDWYRSQRPPHHG